jgi:hypothetical protein
VLLAAERPMVTVKAASLLPLSLDEEAVLAKVKAME